MKPKIWKACDDCGHAFEPACGAQIRCQTCQRGRVRYVFDVPGKLADRFARLARPGERQSATFARLVREAAAGQSLAAAEREAVEKGWIKEEEAT